MKPSNLLTALRTARALGPLVDERAEYSADDLVVMACVELGADVSQGLLYRSVLLVEGGWASPKAGIPGRVFRTAMASAKADDLERKLTAAARR